MGRKLKNTELRGGSDQKTISPMPSTNGSKLDMFGWFLKVFIVPPVKMVKLAVPNLFCVALHQTINWLWLGRRLSEASPASLFLF